MFVNLIPVFVAIFAWFVLGDEITLQKFVGITIVISGLFMAQIRSRRKLVF
jgi:drug/metabolite transporter (DMT)-like permease